MNLTLFCVVLELAALISLINSKMEITTSLDYYIPLNELKINCTSSVPVNENAIEIQIGTSNEQIALIIYYEDPESCKISTDRNIINAYDCQAECSCSQNGKSILFNYNVTSEKQSVTFICSASREKEPLLDSTVIWKAIPVTDVTITPDNTKKTLNIIRGEPLSFTCTTDSGHPAAWIQWYIGEHNVTDQATTVISLNGTNFISTSTLNYTGNETDHNKVVYCEAFNIQGRPKLQSIKKMLNIQIPVKKALIRPVGDDHVISVCIGKNLTFTCTTDSSRPAAWIHWYIGKRNATDQATTVAAPDSTKFISTSTLNYTGKDADHDKNVYCEAVNIEGRQKAKSENKTFYVIVPISSVSISPTFMNNSVTVISEKYFNFTCKTTSSRPGAWIQWYIGGQNVTNSSTSVRTPDGTKFISSSNLNYTGEIDNHDQSIHCEAVNSYDRTVSPNESLYVLSRTMNDETYDLKTDVFIGTNEGINLTVYLIANPKPDITWTLESNQKTSKNFMLMGFNITSVDTFRHFTTYVKIQAFESDFGNYTVEAGNGIESKFVHVFSVKPAQAPSPPFNLDVICDQQIPFINVSWVSNFNGGTQQKFYVVVRKMMTNVLLNSSAQMDRGQTIIHSYESTFDYNSVYEIYVEAHNEYGATNSSGLLNCTTSKEMHQSSRSPSAVIGGAAGISTALVCVAVIGLVVFLRRRRKNKGDEKQHLHRLKGRTGEVVESEEAGLQDNPMYGTSGASVIAVEHAHVQKLTKGKHPSTVETRDKTSKQKKGKETERIQLACVYENSDDLQKEKANSQHGNVKEGGPSTVVLKSIDRKTNKNKDGLMYADLEFASPESGKTFVIRGLENKINYAMVDLSKNAEPLPPDNDADDTINTGQGNTNNS